MISDLEYKLILAFFALILFFSALRTSEFVIHAYNQSVERAETEKKRVARNEPKIQFSSCYYNKYDFYEIIIPFQFLLLSLAFAFAFVRTTGHFVVSMLGPFTLIYGFFDWMRASYFIIVGSESVSFTNTPLSSYLLYNSTILDFVILVGTLGLLIVQSAIVVRFGAKRFHARLNLNDQTSRP